MVCTFGARITHEQAMILVKNFDNVILAFDNDHAGHEATDKAIDKYRKIISFKVLVIKNECKDVGEFTNREEFDKNTEVMEWWKWKE